MLKVLRPSDVGVRTNLGALYHMLGDVNNALLEYNEAMKLDPTDSVLRGNMVRLQRVMTRRTAL